MAVAMSAILEGLTDLKNILHFVIFWVRSLYYILIRNVLVFYLLHLTWHYFGCLGAFSASAKITFTVRYLSVIMACWQSNKFSNSVLARNLCF